MKLEWRKVDRGRLVLYADEHPSMITLEFKPNEMGDHSKPFSLHGGGRFEIFAALEDARARASRGGGKCTNWGCSEKIAASAATKVIE